MKPLVACRVGESAFPAYVRQLWELDVLSGREAAGWLELHGSVRPEPRATEAARRILIDGYRLLDSLDGFGAAMERLVEERRDRELGQS